MVKWEGIYDLIARYKTDNFSNDDYRRLRRTLPAELPENEGCYVVFRRVDKELRYHDANDWHFKNSSSEAVDIIDMILAKHHIQHDAPYNPEVDWKLILCELADFAAMAYRTYHLFGSDFELKSEGRPLSDLRGDCELHLEENCLMNYKAQREYFYEHGDADLVGRSKGFGPR